MSEAEQQYGLRIQELESKLEALSEELSSVGEGNMLFWWMKADLDRVLEDFRDRQIKGDVDEKDGDEQAEDAEGVAAAEELDEVQFINIGKKEEAGIGTAFKAHWIYVSDSNSFSSCDQVTTKDIAETVFLEASQNKIANGVDISNGDLLFLMCRPEIPASGSEETQICTYIGLYLDTAGDQEQEPASETEVLITETLTQTVDEEVRTVASVFVWEECTCDGGDPDGKVNVPTVSTTESNSSSGYVISEKSSGSQNSFVELGDHTITPKVCLLSNPNSVSGTSSSLSIKPVKDVTLNSSSIDLFATKCGTLSKEDSSLGSESSSVLAVSLGSSAEQFNIVNALNEGAPISLGGTDIRAFIPLVSLGDAAKVSQAVESIAFTTDPTTGLPVVPHSETENGVTTTTYTLHLVPQAHYSGITTQDESPTQFDIVTQTLEATDTEVTGFTGSYNELEAFNLSLESEAIPSTDSDPGGSKYTLYREYITAPNTYEKGRLKTPLGNRQTEAKVAVGDFFVPGASAISENNGISGSLSLLGSYDVTMDSKFIEKDDGTQEAVHKIYKTSVTRANISWIDGILTGLGNDVKKENVLVGVIRVPDAPDAYACQYGACVKDPSGEYTDSSCDGQCTDPCVLSYRPSVLYVYVYNESKACWELESEHNIDHSPAVQNSFLTQHYSNFGRLEADCESATDPSNPPVKFYVNNVEVVESDTKILREEPLPYEQLCPDPILPVYEKYVFQASVEVGSQAYTETLLLEPELTTSAHDIVVEFCPGVIPDQLKLVGVGSEAGQTAVLLDTDVDAGVLSGLRSNSEDYSHKIYEVTLPANTQQLQITVDHTQKDLGFYTDTGWILGMYSAKDFRPVDWNTFFNNEPHDFPERIQWRHNSSCSACEQFELQHPYDSSVDGFPGVHYFETENLCNGSTCTHP